ncbi:hypothetical protein CC86DRAFT_412921 [Ophiobolus disseminans]|uniref:CFEM domain-containing protein n=1 Tax=Ophiobolus disseminans TaxID=1469910 RepID=A0A6A6ZFY2_9PLEO|nr:hypothetical protein CC86DRAFT_412921 [Ophiobolus disseminans]
MFALLRLLLAVVLITTTTAEITRNTSVISMLGLIPECSVPCVMQDLFTDGGCPMSTAADLAECACSNMTMKSHLSACVQKSCGFVHQIEVNTFASGLCAAYPKESRVSELKVWAIATIALSVPFLFLRLYSRWLKTGRLYLDDAYAITAAIFLITVSVIILRMSLKGFGLHYWDIPVENGVELLKLYYVCQMLYILVQIFSKVAILSLYQRLFPNFIRWFQWSVRGMIIFMFTHGFVFLMLVTFQCWPISFIWNKTLNGKCLPISVVIGFTGAALSIVEDFIILLLPIHELWKLQMNNRKKIGIILLLSVGSFASITSIVRLRYLLKFANSYDSTWDNVDVIKWSLIEILSACICGNLLPLRPLIDKIVPPVRSLFSRYTRSFSRKSSDKQSGTFSKFSWLDRSGKSNEKPKLISTLNFTQVSLAPDWDWKKSNSSELISPTTPCPAYVGEKAKSLEIHAQARDIEAQDVPRGMIRKTSTTVLNSTQTTTTSDSFGRPSRNDSEAGLMPGNRQREHRHSGPWSYALNIFDRR